MTTKALEPKAWVGLIAAGLNVQRIQPAMLIVTSAEQLEAVYKELNKAGITMLTSRQQTPIKYPAEYCVLCLHTVNELKFAPIPLDDSDGKQFLEQVADGYSKCPKHQFWNMRVESNNVAKMIESIEACRKQFGELFMCSRTPAVPKDDTQRVEWLFSIGTARKK